MNKYQVYNKRESERQDTTDELNRGRRQLESGLKEIEGWPERVMAKLLAPLKNNLDAYPLGHNIRHQGNTGKGPQLWGKL